LRHPPFRLLGSLFGLSTPPARSVLAVDRKFCEDKDRSSLFFLRCFRSFHRAIFGGKPNLQVANMLRWTFMGTFHSNATCRERHGGAHPLLLFRPSKNFEATRLKKIGSFKPFGHFSLGPLISYHSRVESLRPPPSASVESPLVIFSPPPDQAVLSLKIGTETMKNRFISQALPVNTVPPNPSCGANCSAESLFPKTPTSSHQAIFIFFLLHLLA